MNFFWDYTKAMKKIVKTWFFTIHNRRGNRLLKHLIKYWCWRLGKKFAYMAEINLDKWFLSRIDTISSYCGRELFMKIRISTGIIENIWLKW